MHNKLLKEAAEQLDTIVEEGYIDLYLGYGLPYVMGVNQQGDCVFSGYFRGNKVEFKWHPKEEVYMGDSWWGLAENALCYGLRDKLRKDNAQE
jgi:hypothetical protein